VHRYDKVKASRYVPRANCETPLAGWKRIDMLQQDLPGKDRGARNRQAAWSPRGLFGKVAQGDPEPEGTQFVSRL